MKRLLLVILVACFCLLGCDYLTNDNRITTTDEFKDVVTIYPGQAASYNGWWIVLNGGQWDRGELTIDISITNKSNGRRYFSHPFNSYGSSYSLVAVDSTNKKATPYDSSFRSLYGDSSFYTDKEFYPDESLTGELVYQLSEYSGHTNIHIAYIGAGGRYLIEEIFCVWSPMSP